MKNIKFTAGRKFFCRLVGGFIRRLRSMLQFGGHGNLMSVSCFARDPHNHKGNTQLAQIKLARAYTLLVGRFGLSVVVCLVNLARYCDFIWLKSEFGNRQAGSRGL